MWRNSLSSSSDAVPSIKKEKLKFFLDSKSALEMTYHRLLAREVNELEAIYALVQDLDSAWTSHPFKSHDYRTSMLDLPHSPIQ